LNKLILLVLILTLPIFAQQINYTWGVQLDGSDYGGAGETPAAKTSSYTFYVDISDYYPIDMNPYVVSYTAASSDTVGLDSLYYAVFNNSSRSVFGTLYMNFDNQGAAPTADSVIYTISVYPGVYGTDNKSLAGAKWGTAVTLETVEETGDYFSINNVYVHATKYKTFPPEVLKFTLASINRNGWDDSTFVSWKYAYPAIYHPYSIQKPE